MRTAVRYEYLYPTHIPHAKYTMITKTILRLLISEQVQSVVDLVSEGRGALHTSFAAVKFLIIYGLNFSVLKLCSYWCALLFLP